MQTSGESASTTQIVQKSVTALPVSVKLIEKHRVKRERSAEGPPCSLTPTCCFPPHTGGGLAGGSVQSAGDRRGHPPPAPMGPPFSSLFLGQAELPFSSFPSLKPHLESPPPSSFSHRLRDLVDICVTSPHLSGRNSRAALAPL